MHAMHPCMHAAYRGSSCTGDREWLWTAASCHHHHHHHHHHHDVPAHGRGQTERQGRAGRAGRQGSRQAELRCALLAWLRPAHRASPPRAVGPRGPSSSASRSCCGAGSIAVAGGDRRASASSRPARWRGAAACAAGARLGVRWRLHPCAPSAIDRHRRRRRRRRRRYVEGSRDGGEDDGDDDDDEIGARAARTPGTPHARGSTRQPTTGRCQRGGDVWCWSRPGTEDRTHTERASKLTMDGAGQTGRQAGRQAGQQGGGGSSPATGRRMARAGCTRCSGRRRSPAR
jgi:hypothetical protein